MLDVGIKGVNRLSVKKMRNGTNPVELKFNALKFDSTSYNSEVEYLLFFSVSF